MRQIISSKVLERLFYDQTRPIRSDWMCPASDPLLACTTAHVSVHHHLTGCMPCVFGHFYCSVSGQTTEGGLHCAPLTGHGVRVRSLPKAKSDHFETSPFDPKLHHPCSNMPTTKGIILCTCVSIFSQTFLRVLHSLESKCICNELEHLVAL
jgi:hypothetical protein